MKNDIPLFGLVKLEDDQEEAMEVWLGWFWEFDNGLWQSLKGSLVIITQTLKAYGGEWLPCQTVKKTKIGPQKKIAWLASINVLIVYCHFPAIQFHFVGYFIWRFYFK